MKILYHGANVYRKGRFQALDIFTDDGIVVDISPSLSCSADTVFVFKNNILIPGLADVHTHLREPGFSYKETVASGSLAGVAGGYTALCAMPNLNPTPDTPENLAVEQAIIDETAVIPVLPYAAITIGEQGQQLVDVKNLAPRCFAFSDDGKGVQSRELMKEAMIAIKAAGSLLAAHCEDESLLDNGYIHKGRYAAAHGHRGICSQSEWGPIKRDLELVEETGCRYHVCHVSTKESVELIRQAKARGLPVSCETAPHYLVLCEDDLQEHGRFKMNPPLRSREDQEALLEGILDGTIDIIATDHAPHSAEEKAKGLEGSAMGIVGLETAFPVLYTRLVGQGVLTLEQLVELMSLAPRRLFPQLPGGEIEIGKPLDATVIDLEDVYEINPEGFRSQGRASPFSGWQVRGRIKTTIAGGRIVWNEK